jgi:hypothetical protein
MAQCPRIRGVSSFINRYPDKYLPRKKQNKGSEEKGKITKSIANVFCLVVGWQKPDD